MRRLQILQNLRRLGLVPDRVKEPDRVHGQIQRFQSVHPLVFNGVRRFRPQKSPPKGGPSHRHVDAWTRARRPSGGATISFRCRPFQTWGSPMAATAIEVKRVAGVLRLIQALFGLDNPDHMHHEVIRDETGERLAKRSDSQSLSALRQAGIAPENVKRLLGFGA